jgi:enoyl-CoA hydratase/carnithine racemase
MSSNKYSDIIFEIVGQIGIIKFNRPKSLNSFGGKLMVETVTAIRELNEHPDTVFTVLTGEGRFFSAGADVKGRFDCPRPILMEKVIMLYTSCRRTFYCGIRQRRRKEAGFSFEILNW